MIKLRVIKLLCILIVSAFYSCDSSRQKKFDFAIKILPKDKLPYSTDTIIKNGQFLLSNPYCAAYKDSSGIPLTLVENKKHYNPVGISQIGLDYINKYYSTSNKLYLDTAEQYANCLIKISKEYKGAIWFPYTFNFKLHDIEDQVMVAPWYSAMAQGQALSLFTRLYEETQNPIYSKNADKIFLSFFILKNGNNPYVVYYDKNHQLWLEEYPMDEATNALNGFIFSIFGIYDYYRIHPDKPYVKNILVNSISTVYNNINDFEKKNEYSYYCLKHKVQDRNYHYTHIYQLKVLYDITGENYFLKMADTFWKDGKNFEKENKN